MRYKVVLPILLTSMIVACSSDGETPLLSDVAHNGSDASSVGGLSSAEGSEFGGTGLARDEMVAGSESDNDGYSYDDTQYPNAFLGPEFKEPGSALAKSVIYFLYDSSQVQDSFVPVIAAHARYLVKHPFARVTLAGHADERGSPEYNIALGEYRAKAVARMLKIQGVSDDQLQIVSYGEEKPANPAQGEASWQLNRRVELLYQGK